eukprot:CAMPEP_0197031914 /NCGR_PEP_ID=MMETSP1384-20130603/10742_1 /TAXON_ID=29189 /ORGANISM="Ammonia sp." /LENGTH=513 /DNA_ID=CAMNT_0042461495 /DNA_START=33 /DNA_END=1574 /DNA_ORIENTATION=-
MGKEISRLSEEAGVSCCTQALTYDSGDDSEDPTSSPLARAAQSLCHRKDTRTSNNTSNWQQPVPPPSRSSTTSRRKKSRHRSSSAATRSESKSRRHKHLDVPFYASPPRTFSSRRQTRSRRNHSRKRSHSLSILRIDTSPTTHPHVHGEQSTNGQVSGKCKLSKTRKLKHKKKRSKKSTKTGTAPNAMRRERSHSMEDANSYRRNVSQAEQQLLEEQFNSLHRQNSAFMAKHAPYFTDSLDYTEKPALLIASNSLHSLHSETTSSSRSHQNQGSMSPISSLSGKHMNIILSYSNSSGAFALEPSVSVTDLPGSDGFGDATRLRSCSVPHTMDELELNEQDDDEEEFVVQRTKNANDVQPCDCVANCGSIKRIITALKWYDGYLRNEEQDEEEEDEEEENVQLFLERIMDEFGGNPYDNYLVKDYQHVLKYHLMHSFDISMGIEYALIQNELNKCVGSCDVRRCQGFKRYRAANPDGGRSALRVEPQCSGDADSFFLDFMDLIHCFLMHLDSLQ